MTISLDLLSFLAGLGLFLYGMSHLEDGLKVLSSDSFRRFLRRSTGNPISSMLGGTLTTMLVQSSSMVGLMMMAFVGAGVIPLYNAVGVVLGANLGTTFTGWIVATLGFKLSLSTIAIPCMGAGALWVVLFRQRERWLAAGSLVLGLGMLVFGLDVMKSSMEQVSAHFDVVQLQGYPAIVYLLVGVLFTALIQSSSATMMITLSALHVGIVDLNSAAALVIGADLGTTSTMALGAIRAPTIKKQLALAHVLINVVTAVLAFSLLPALLWFVQALIGLDDPLYQLVAFHSSFNVLGIVVMLPFIKPFSRFLEKRFLGSEEDVRTYINSVPPAMVNESIIAVTKEVECLLLKSVALALRNMKLDVGSLHLSIELQQRLQAAFDKHKRFIDCYDDIKKLEGEILEFAGAVQTGVVDQHQVKVLHRLLSGARHGVYAAKSLKDIRENLAALRHSEKTTLSAFYQEQIGIQKQHWVTLLNLLSADHQPAFLREELNHLRDQNRDVHQQIEQSLFSKGLHDGADEKETSTLLNVNREFRASIHNVVKALGYLRLEDELFEG